MTELAEASIEGLQPFVRNLEEADRHWPGAKRKVEAKIGKTVGMEARSFAVGTGRMQTHFAGRISGGASPQGAYVGVSRIANAAFWGAKKHTGWYGKPQYNASPPQFPAWVGNAWAVGVPGQGPLAINPAIFHSMQMIEHEYGDAIEQLWNGRGV